MLYAYPDAYLGRHITPDIEARALADVQVYRAAFPAAWQERLVRLRAYVLACQEGQRTADDLFSVKLAGYKKEFNELLPLACAAADAASAAAPSMVSLVSIELQRA